MLWSLQARAQHAFLHALSNVYLIYQHTFIPGIYYAAAGHDMYMYFEVVRWELDTNWRERFVRGAVVNGAAKFSVMRVFFCTSSLITHGT